MILQPVLREIADQRMWLFHWLPVAMAVGVGIFFGYGWWITAALCVSVFLMAALYLAVIGWRDHAMLPWLVLALFVGLGGVAAMGRSYLVSAPVLSYPYYGDILGRVIAVDRSNSDAPRYTLDQLTLGPIPSAKTPHKIRVSVHDDSVHDDTDALDPQVGDIIKLRGYISPPQGPVEPHGFDFRKYAYFLELGAVGYARDPPQIIGQSQTRFWFKSMQRWLTDVVDQSTNASVAGFAKALIAGDWRDMPVDVIADLRATNLAHLLAISGLHMGLLTSLVYFSVRVICVLARGPFGRHARPVAALAAICIGALYLGVSGGNIATQRAFIMMATFYGAVILGQRVISFRALALAALIILLYRPESFFSPGFQMSFSATLALICAFRLIADRTRMGPTLQFITSLAVSSFVAGAATAPFSAMHFNTFSTVSFLANVSAVPVMSVVVAPAALVGVLMAGVGLAPIAFVPMEWGLHWILGVAHYFAQWSGATKPIITPAPWTGLTVTAAGLLLALWQGWYGRALGVLLCAISVMGWIVADRPDILISRDARLVGVMTEQGRALSKARGDQFTANIWAENDGRPVPRDVAHALWQEHGGQIGGQIGAQNGSQKGTHVIHLWSKKQTGATITCTQDQIVVSAVEISVDGPCLWITQEDTQSQGAAAIYFDTAGHPQVVWAEAAPPVYPWTEGRF